MEGMMISGTRSFDYEKEEKFFLGFMRMIFIVCLLVFIWCLWAHAGNVQLKQTGTSVLATPRSGGRYLQFVAEDNITHIVDITGMFLTDFEEDTLVYYTDDPSAARPLTATSFFVTIYAVTIAGMAFSLWQIIRIKKSISKNTAIPDEE